MLVICEKLVSLLLRTQIPTCVSWPSVECSAACKLQQTPFPQLNVPAVWHHYTVVSH